MVTVFNEQLLSNVQTLVNVVTVNYLKFYLYNKFESLYVCILYVDICFILNHAAAPFITAELISIKHEIDYDLH